MTPLTICISSLRSRSASLAALLQSLALQERAEEVEVLVAIDGRQADGLQTTTGAKRNQLVAIARGRYIVHVDDDDTVSPSYIPDILAAIDRAPSVDVILIRGERLDDGCKAWEFAYCATGKWEPYKQLINAIGVEIWKSPDHLCPLRADIVKAHPFPNKRVNEDVEWSMDIAPLIRTSERAGDRVLYTYHTTAGREWERVE